MPIHVDGLMIELAAAGIANTGCNDLGIVWGLDGSEIQTRADVAAVIVGHDYAAWVAYDLRVQVRQGAAHNIAKAIPNWATWTQQDIQGDYDTNLTQTEIDKVTSLAAARVMMARQNTRIVNLEKMLAAIRDYVMPELPE